MAQSVRAFKDRSGKLHEDAERATIADIAAVLGRVGGETGIAEGIARKIVEDWSEFEAVMIEHHAIAEPKRSLKLVEAAKS